MSEAMSWGVSVLRGVVGGRGEGLKVEGGMVGLGGCLGEERGMED